MKVTKHRTQRGNHPNTSQRGKLTHRNRTANRARRKAGGKTKNKADEQAGCEASKQTQTKVTKKLTGLKYT